MTKRPNLKTRLATTAGSTRETSEPQPVRRTGAKEARPDRIGKSPVIGYFPSEVRKQLKIIAAEEDKTQQQLLGEALNSLFAKYGKAEIAPIERE